MENFMRLHALIAQLRQAEREAADMGQQIAALMTAQEDRHAQAVRLWAEIKKHIMGAADDEEKATADA